MVKPGRSLSWRAMPVSVKLMVDSGTVPMTHTFLLLSALSAPVASISAVHVVGLYPLEVCCVWLSVPSCVMAY